MQCLPHLFRRELARTTSLTRLMVKMTSDLGRVSDAELLRRRQLRAHVASRTWASGPCLPLRSLRVLSRRRQGMKLARRMAPRWVKRMARRVGNPYWTGVDELWEQFAAGSVGATGALCERMEVCRDGLAFGLGGQSSRVLAASMDEPWGAELRSAGCASPLHESTTAALTLLAPGVGGDTTHIYVDGTGGSERGPAAWGFAVCRTPEWMNLRPGPEGPMA